MFINNSSVKQKHRWLQLPLPALSPYLQYHNTTNVVYNSHHNSQLVWLDLNGDFKAQHTEWSIVN